ncbi:unnamed protein product [Phytophthora fragariaefolia]|uniref:Histone-lysine N-methyltransferase, H3 lysine-79 specific n=1 Tax=Phytophthora fragariaefolia TaxID=1490495 RepID=A0A9W6U024_9STRA|nr:unnamed protein product [Phytophthora fragariaefolia]
MRTPFTFDDVKELVQIACQDFDGGARVAWQGVANKMQRTGHTALVLRQRLHTLMRTWGRDLTRFPPSSFAQVHRPRGRPLAITRPLRGAAPAAPTASSQRPVSAATPPPPAPAASFSPLAPASCPARTIPATRPEGPTPTTSPAGTTPTPSPTGLTPTETSQRPAPVASSPLSSAPAATCSPCPSLATKSPNDASMSGRDAVGASVETIVHAIFENVPRVLVTRDCNTPHRNVGEKLPQGITILLDELRKIDPIDERNVFLDIGAGLGNIVVHVALATTDQRAIGIELREDVYQLGLQMIGENVHGRRLRSRLLIICGDVAEAKLSRYLPYEQANIVYWNNVLFEPHVIEIVKEHLSYMSDIRIFVSTVQIYPRNRELCF